MTVIDLTSEKYKQNKVVVKCGDKEFSAVADDKTIDKVIAASKKQIKDGFVSSRNFDKLSDGDSDLTEKQIDELVDNAVNTVAHTKEDYMNLANAIFGRGAGSAIYKAVGSSTIVMGQVMNDVTDELYAKNAEMHNKYHKKPEEV